MPVPFVRLGQLTRFDQYPCSEEGGHDFPAEQRLVALVIRVRNQRHTGRNQLRARGVDPHRPLRAVEGDLVVRPGRLAVLDLGLGNRRVVVDVPE